MQVELISIGDELLIGQTVNTNASWIGSKLSHEGFQIVQTTVISDDEQAILFALREAEKRADIILITGGLGPTKDDITKHVLCNYFDTKLVRNDAILKHIQEFFKARGREMLEVNTRQADLPEACEPLHNPIGTAAGMWFEKNNKIFVSMPGVPYEMKEIMNQHVIPRLKEKFDLDVIVHHTILTQGIGESFLAEKIKIWENKLRADNLSLAYLPSPGMVRLRITGKGNDEKLIQEKIKNYTAKLLPQIENYFFGFGNDTLEKIVGQLLLEKKATLSTAESCTGGYVAHKITSISGSSDYFIGSIISYSNQVKINELKVREEDLKNQGAVSKAVVEQMSIGVREKLNTDYSIAISGVAGPGGGSAEKPVGTVWIAVSSKDKTVSKDFLFENDRNRNITRASLTSLMMLKKLLENKL